MYLPPPEFGKFTLQQEDDLLQRGVQVLSEEALNAAVMMKHTGRETRRYHAIASAWKMQEAEQYHKFISLIHKSDHEWYWDFDKLSLNKIIYEDDLESFKAADIQLNWLEEEVQSQLKSEGGEQEGKKMPVECSSQSHCAEEADDDDNNGNQDQCVEIPCPYSTAFLLLWVWTCRVPIT